jgi:hypothetical protein
VIRREVDLFPSFESLDSLVEGLPDPSVPDLPHITF